MACKVAHLTSAHERTDTRIYLKQCRSLSSHGFDVSLVVADGLGECSVDGVSIVDAGKSPGRINRILKSTRKVLRKALDINADVYHLHDPELIPAGLRLKLAGKIVIFDAHEDLPKQLLGKPYLGPVQRKALSLGADLFERFVCRYFDGVVGATPYIRDKFLRINSSTVDINNFPIIGELDSAAGWDNKKSEVCYVGGYSTARGICELVRALDLTKTSAKLNLAGKFIQPDLEGELKQCHGWSKVNEFGFLDRRGVRSILERSLAGLVTLHPLVNYLDALPVKMFEYMAAGIPVIASDFPLWREIVEGNDCGLCVNPLNPAAIAEAIDYFVSHPEEAGRMGNNGRKAVVDRYNWKAEEQKLICFYEGLLKNSFPVEN